MLPLKEWLLLGTSHSLCLLYDLAKPIDGIPNTTFMAGNTFQRERSRSRSRSPEKKRAVNRENERRKQDEKTAREKRRHFIVWAWAIVALLGIWLMSTSMQDILRLFNKVRARFV